MGNLHYKGEHIWAGQLGNLFIVLSFAAAALSLACCLLSVKNNGYKKIARMAFNIHAISVLGIIATLFFMLFNHFFEYQYVWQHSNTEMDRKFILSCFWEGQEGSFLLWTFWNMVLALILRKQLRADDSLTAGWEMPVMTLISLVQLFLASMILGVYIGDYRVGSNPFLLLREHPEFANLPFVQNADYLKKLDGRGLNPLLMNYWMTIHPPVLFLGFASTLIPFAFALAALWNKKYTEWLKPALPWAFFGVLILGTGILMGGAWAYEALSFGGFWAWDPVENSSLVPWLVLVGGAHTMLAGKNKNQASFAAHFLCISAFILVLYSTFLTRSGILGNASVHAFTDLGMTGQLLIYLLSFVFIAVLLLLEGKLWRNAYAMASLFLLFFSVLYEKETVGMITWLVMTAGLTAYAYYRFFPQAREEDELFSREFWIFLGSVALLVTAVIITYFTSIPVINKLFGSSYAPPKAPYYNLWITPFAILILLLMGVGLFLKYRKTAPAAVFRQLMISFTCAVLFAIVAAIPLYYLTDNSLTTGTKVSCSILLFAGLFAAFANAEYFMRMLRGKVAKGGSAIAHTGFALLVIGALISTSKRATISRNTSDKKVSSLGAEFDDRKSILLTQGDTLPMGPYLVTYSGKERQGLNVSFHVDYLKAEKNAKPEFLFRLSPRVQDNPRMGKAPEPATRHYLNRDIYTHVTYADLEVDTLKERKKGYASPKNFVGHPGDTIFASNALVIIDSLRSNVGQKEYERSDSLLIITATLRCVDVKGRTYKAHPQFVVRNRVVIPLESVVEQLGLKFLFWKVNPQESTIEITVQEKLSNARDFIVMEAYMFPYINLLWLGCVIMALGTLIAILERIRKFRRRETA
jgi:cytochrome c-type biogenesis protein CcmF